MSQLTKTETTSKITTSFAERVAQKQAARNRCLLLDTSGSMASPCGDGRSKIAALRQLAEGFSGERKFAFSSFCHEITDIPDANGGTAMCQALEAIKSVGVTHAVLITDGEQTDGQPEDVYRAAEGLKLDIFYVGPGEPPPMLIELAKRTGGSFGHSDLKETKVLSSQIKGLLKS